MNHLITKMKLTTFIILIFTVISCSNDENNTQEEIINEEILQSIELTIDGKTYKSTNNETSLTLLGTNYQGDASLYAKNGNIPEYDFDLKYQFTEAGNLISFELEETKHTDGADIVKKFMTPTYKPLNSFQIHKFEINETTKKILIEFSGILYSESDSQENRHIEGKIYNSFSTLPLWGRDYCYMKSNTGSLNFLTSFYQVRNNGSGEQYIDYVSGDGYNISIQLNQPLMNFTNLTFNEDATTNKVVVKKALAPFLINDNSLGQLTSQQQWENYKTSGNLSVTNTYIGSKPGGGTHIKGLINLTIKDQNNNSIDILELEFVTIN